MLHREGGANNFCFSALLSAGGCGKVIRSSREAGKEDNSHLKCMCEWDTLPSLWPWSAANPGGGIFLYSATCTDVKHHLSLGTSELFPVFIFLFCFLFLSLLTQTRVVAVYHLIPFSALSVEVSTVLGKHSSLRSLLLRWKSETRET